MLSSSVCNSLIYSHLPVSIILFDILISYPLFIASISSSYKLGEAISKIFPPLLIKLEIP